VDITDYELTRLIDYTDAKIYKIETYSEEQMKELVDEEISFSFSKEDMSNTGIYHLTSGTTCRPKLCIRTLEAIMNEALSYKETYSLYNRDKILSIPTLQHSYAMGAALFTSIVLGASLHMIDNFIPRKVINIIKSRKITVLIMVPIIAKALCNTFTQPTDELSSIRIALVGAGAISAELYYGFKEKFGITLLSNYGSTETGGVIARTEPLPYSSIGKPMSGVKVKLCDDNGERVKQGQEGEIRVKCDGMLRGYLMEETSAFDDEGYFKTGDIAIQDEQDNLLVKYRKKLLINVGGKKILPCEIEEVLLSFNGVKECVVVGIGEEQEQKGVKAIIVGEEIDEVALREYCAKKLENYKLPSIIEFRQSISKNNLGKISYSDLAK
jgi:long-chain acyl-CoA synthetase